MWTSKTPPCPLGWSFELSWETWNCWARYKQNMSKDKIKTLLSQKVLFCSKIAENCNSTRPIPRHLLRALKTRGADRNQNNPGLERGRIPNRVGWKHSLLGLKIAWSHCKTLSLQCKSLLQFRAKFKAELTKKQNSLTHCWMSNFYRGVEMVGLQPSCVSVSERKQE